MESPKISIIIPCYNVEKYIDQCMESVLNQTLQNIEVICINDGSTDNTLAYLEEYGRRDSRVRVYDQVNQGVSVTRNKGIDMSGGEYIAFLDPDDFYPSYHTLELLYTKAVYSGAAICGGSFSNYNHLSGKVTRCYLGDFLKYSFKEEGVIYYKDYQFDYGYHRFIYLRTFLLGNNLYFPEYARFQDPPFFVRAMILAEWFYAIPDVVYRYRIGNQDKPTSWPRKKLHDMICGYRDVLLLSREYRLQDLHALTVRRLEEDAVNELIVNSLQENDKTTNMLLQQINESIDCALLKEGGMNIDPNNEAYIIRELRQNKERTRKTFLYTRVGMIYACIRQQGLRYTVQLFIEKLGA